MTLRIRLEFRVQQRLVNCTNISTGVPKNLKQLNKNKTLNSNNLTDMIDKVIQNKNIEQLIDLIESLDFIQDNTYT